MVAYFTIQNTKKPKPKPETIRPATIPETIRPIHNTTCNLCGQYIYCCLCNYNI
jgi:hypothetical protein